jgi:hypothetical protein
MKRSFLWCSAVILTLCISFEAGAGQLVREFSGSRSTETVEFEVKAPWLIDWRVNSDYPETMGIAVSLAYGGTDAYAGKVFKTKRPGTGLRLVEEGGRFRFKVDAAVAYWTLKVIQLSPEEAEQYKPKKVLDY